MSLSKAAVIRTILFIVVMVPVALLFGVIKLPSTKVNKGSITGAATPWTIQLATAAREARNDFKDPVLIAVEAEPVNAIPLDLLEDQAFTVTFLFVENTPEQAKLFVDLNDSEPFQTIHKGGSFIPIDNPKENMTKYKDALATVKQSPRDIYYRTSVDASATLGKSESGYIVDLNLHLFPQFKDMPVNQAVWSIYYFRPESAGKPEKRIDYLINAADGTILQRVEGMGVFSTKTPATLP